MTQRNPCPRFVIAGTHSGVGKTTVAIGIMAALRRRGFDVRPFKVGPDYIDPSYHRLACGQPSETLDSWMLGKSGLRRSFSRTAVGDISVIEGMMGLHDGASPNSDTGSTAEVAKLLKCPVVLVVDASALARSVGAIVLGYKMLDPKVNVAGVIVNRVSGEGHAAYLRPAIEAAGVKFLGWLPPNSSASIPERHLGLVMPGEYHIPELIDDLARVIEERIDMDALISIANESPAIDAAAARPTRRRASARIAVAQDEAFCFYYPDNLALLQQAGAEIVPFSPIRDRALPPQIDGLYFGGGYPEVHATALSKNRAMRDEVAAAHREGMAIFAECGGFMYLCEQLINIGGAEYAMAAIVPGCVRMHPTLQAIGYRDVTFDSDVVLGPKGTTARGHEFRYSCYEGPIGTDSSPFTVGDVRHGYCSGNLVASYLHLHFGSQPALADNWVRRCRAARK